MEGKKTPEVHGQFRQMKELKVESETYSAPVFRAPVGLFNFYPSWYLFLMAN